MQSIKVNRGQAQPLGAHIKRMDLKNSDPGFELEASFFIINCFVEGMVAKFSLIIN